LGALWGACIGIDPHDTPDELKVLAPLILKEIVYRLLMG
jgi:AraC-type transcriptional regulator N-terminus